MRDWLRRDRQTDRQTEAERQRQRNRRTDRDWDRWRQGDMIQTWICRYKGTDRHFNLRERGGERGGGGGGGGGGEGRQTNT